MWIVHLLQGYHRRPSTHFTMLPCPWQSSLQVTWPSYQEVHTCIQWFLWFSPRLFCRSWSYCCFTAIWLFGSPSYVCSNPDLGLCHPSWKVEETRKMEPALDVLYSWLNAKTTRNLFYWYLSCRVQPLTCTLSNELTRCTLGAKFPFSKPPNSNN